MLGNIKLRIAAGYTDRPGGFKKITMPAPVKHTCPNIDRVIKNISAAIRSAKDGIKDPEVAVACLINIINDLDDVVDKLEDLRRSNEALRTWGEESELRIKELELDLDPYEKTL